MTLSLPRFVITKPLANGRTGFYFNVSGRYRAASCPIAGEALGSDYAVACGSDGNGGRAAALNALFDEWQDMRRGLPVSGDRVPVYGTIRWLFQEYRRSKAYTEKVSARSRPDYERTMQLVEHVITKKGDKLGDRKIKSHRSAPIKSMGLSWPVSTVSARAKLRRRWLCVDAHGVSFIGCTLPSLTGTYRILGMASPSSVARKTKSRPLLVIRSMRSPGALLSAGGQKLPLPPLSVSSGYSVPKTCWLACCSGPTIATRNGRMRLKFCTTRRAQPCGIH